MQPCQSVGVSCYFLTVTTASLRFLPLGQIHMAFGDVHLTPGSGTHRLVFPVKITGTWLDPDAPTSNTAALLVGTVWTSQPYFRWLAGLEPQVLTLRGFAAGEELVLSLSDEQLIALERARGEDDIVLNLKLHATLLPPYEGVHPITGPARGSWRLSFLGGCRAMPTQRKCPDELRERAGRPSGDPDRRPRLGPGPQDTQPCDRPPGLWPVGLQLRDETPAQPRLRPAAARLTAILDS